MAHKVILQHDERDCGAACLSMVAHHYGYRFPLAHFRELTKTDRMGTNIYGLVNGAEQIGLHAQALVGTPEDLLQMISEDSLSFPAIVLLQTQDNLLHDVVLFSFDRGRICVGDPGSGKVKYNIDDFFSQWTGHIITFKPAEGFVKKHSAGTLMRFFALLQGQHIRIGLILLMSFLTAIIGMAGAFVFQIVIDGISKSQLAGHTVTAIFLALIGLYLLMAFISFARGYLILKISKAIDIRLSLSYYNHIVDLPMASVAVRQTGEYLSRFSDTDTIREAISEASVTLILDSVMVIASGIILYLQNSKLFIISLAMIITYAIAVLSFREPLSRSSRKAMEEDAKLQSYFKETVDGIETVKANNACKLIQKLTRKKFMSFLNAGIHNNILFLSQETIVTAVEMIGTAAILWAGFLMVLNNQTTVGMLITFYGLLSYFTEPIKNLIELQPAMQKAFIAADRLNDILILKAEEEEKTENSIRKKEQASRPKNNLSESGLKHIEFRNIDFRYGNRNLTLENINMDIRQGDRIAIVGESGSGKTTLMKLLLRFYDPEKGEIIINNLPIKEYDIDELRAAVAYVDQNTFLFSDTIFNNIRLGNPEATNDEIIEVCKLAKADDFIRDLPFGYETLLEENGMNISGGQRQRIAIARALLRHPSLLILDEATSHLDTITEYGIKNTVFDMNTALTCIIIAHRLSTIRQCDKIIVMDHGQIAEFGSHDELMKLGGKYCHLQEKM